MTACGTRAAAERGADEALSLSRCVHSLPCATANKIHLEFLVLSLVRYSMLYLTKRRLRNCRPVLGDRCSGTVKHSAITGHAAAVRPVMPASVAAAAAGRARGGGDALTGGATGWWMATKKRFSSIRQANYCIERYAPPSRSSTATSTLSASLMLSHSESSTEPDLSAS